MGALCGTAMAPPMASFAAHVASTGDARAMRFTGERTLEGDTVQGAPDSFEYRVGFRLTSSG
jgi:hypothetical protein